ncbi:MULTISPECIES: methionine--tRNA ligase [Microbacterium]|uniref:Methionine--tRNA ligase n=1 Tax=Microbacterium barkeri TaxID=33917 RepID=A0A9W6LW38_9MICO|nr:methionine--tRNA ligase [Microbacterium barkeri]MDI6942986.1 methionine--tRNA ligase [Microbacterium barkeri]MDR6876521.1 methionyl-tRNA synthetase [Microbacterium barkeri]GLJ60986.1 methionine--tRNA ligase [Microbacterium barkeri]
MTSGRSFYITTPIYYPSDVPHIGHGYTTVAVDTLARWHRQAGDDTWMLTGTDEHGQKMIRAAAANGATPQEWVDKLVAESWQPLLRTLDVANDDFIRTTQERHEKSVQLFLQAVYDRGYIYAGEYEALYCVGCEEFKPDSEIVDGTGPFEGLKVCAIHSKPLELLQEKNYFFKLSEFQDRLLELYRERPDFVQPESARNEVVAFVQQGLKDLSISRSTFDWGITVPWDESHVIYVWVDALLNYATAVGYGSDPDNFARRWPAHHVVGKDILRFHAVIWPAMLMAAGIEVPENVFAHGWLLVGGEKMSKSKLTGIAPNAITDVFGSDAYRFYFLSAISFGQDGSFSWEDLSARYQAELANGFGNLASRTIAMIGKYFDGVVPAPAEYADGDLAIQRTVAEAARKADAAIDRFRIDEAIRSIWTIVDELNGYITENEPWALAKDDAQRDRLATVLYTCAEGLRALAVLLSPVMPQATGKLWDALGVESALGALVEQPVREAGAWGGIPAGTATSTLQPLFPRVEQPE